MTSLSETKRQMIGIVWEASCHICIQIWMANLCKSDLPFANLIPNHHLAPKSAATIGWLWGIGYYLYEEPLRDTRGTERSQGVWAYKPPMAPEVPIEFLGTQKLLASSKVLVRSFYVVCVDGIV